MTRRTTLGFDVIDFARDVLGIELFPWQCWLLLHMLELLPDGSLRFRTVVVLVARQNGKSLLSQVLALWFMVIWGWPLVLGTAQDLETAEEVWQGAVDLVEEDPVLSQLLKRVVKVNGKKALELTSGARYKVKAANRRAGRGFSGNLIMLDELREHQSWDAWGAITKTTMARVEALVLALSNAGDATSIVLRYLRKMAHASIGDPDGICGEDTAALLPEADADDDPDEFEQDADTLGIFEWSARPGCDKWDRDGWAQGNPAMNHPNGIPERNISAACKTDPEWVFRTEVLCQWSDGSLEGPFPPGTWEAGIDATSAIPDGATIRYCLDVSWDRAMSYIAVSGLREDGLPHVEIIAQRSGTEWVVSRHKRPDGTDEMRGWFADRATEANPMTVVVQAKGAPASSLVDDLKDVPFLTVLEWAGSELGAASGQFYDLVVRSKAPEGKSARAGLCHRPQPVLDVAAGTAVTKPLGDSWVWNRKASLNDAAPLVAATGAAWGALQRVEVPFVSAYETAGVGAI
ncbi:MAG: hypothetical protein ACOH10_07945 [Rhodoglobus sp.]